MTKAEIFSRIAQETKVDTSLVREIMEEGLEQIKKANIEGHDVFFRGFGSFNVVQRKAKIGRNISKGTAIPIPAVKIPKFKPSAEFSGKVKGVKV